MRSQDQSGNQRTTSGESGAQFEISAILPKDGIRPRIIDAFHSSLSQAISRGTQSEKSHEVACQPSCVNKKRPCAGHVAANSCAMLCQCCAHQGSYQVSISLFLCHLMFCKTTIKEWDRIGHRTEILAGYHVSSSWYRPSTLSPAWQSH